MAIETKPGAAPQPGQPNQPSQPNQPAQPKPESKPATASRGGSDEGDGLREEVQAGHKARTTVPGHEGVDARLDNRAGVFRPPLESWPAKPQQVDGPDLAGQIEFTRKHLQGDSVDVGDRKGQFSPGPHGLSDEKLRESDEPLYGSESVSEGDVASGSKA